MPTVPTVSAGTAVTDQPRPSTQTAIASPAASTEVSHTVVTGTADSPGTPVAQQQSAQAAIASCTAGRTVAAVAPQDAAVPAGLSHRTTGPVGAVADQRTPQQRLGGRVHRVQQVLLRVGNLGARI
ncbi:Uncharacterised protein [Mycobacterium tuberculosis]|uniref:Uncharacterized protein n=1 Tax=Mycobacterium tuberculosis TaxID=1773 RepID=A0A654TLK5_MYCTX|nr:Uncharacterised protein [Mycobacterium tuberculosis]